MLCRSFFTPGRDIGSAVFMVWDIVLNYPDQNISNQFKPKKLLYIKSLGTEKTGVTPMRSDGQITADTKQKSNITNSVSPYYTSFSQKMQVTNLPGNFTYILYISY
jgi:hypothetical protein